LFVWGEQESCRNTSLLEVWTTYGERTCYGIWGGRAGSSSNRRVWGVGSAEWEAVLGGGGRRVTAEEHKTLYIRMVRGLSWHMRSGGGPGGLPLPRV